MLIGAWMPSVDTVDPLTVVNSYVDVCSPLVGTLPYDFSVVVAVPDLSPAERPDSLTKAEM